MGYRGNFADHDLGCSIWFAKMQLLSDWFNREGCLLVWCYAQSKSSVVQIRAPGLGASSFRLSLKTDKAFNALRSAPSHQFPSGRAGTSPQTPLGKPHRTGTYPGPSRARTHEVRTKSNCGPWNGLGITGASFPGLQFGARPDNV